MLVNPKRLETLSPLAQNSGKSRSTHDAEKLHCGPWKRLLAREPAWHDVRQSLYGTLWARAVSCSVKFNASPKPPPTTGKVVRTGTRKRPIRQTSGNESALPDPSPTTTRPRSSNWNRFGGDPILVPNAEKPLESASLLCHSGRRTERPRQQRYRVRAVKGGLRRYRNAPPQKPLLRPDWPKWGARRCKRIPTSTKLLHEPDVQAALRSQ